MHGGTVEARARGREGQRVHRAPAGAGAARAVRRPSRAADSGRSCRARPGRGRQRGRRRRLALLFEMDGDEVASPTTAAAAVAEFRPKSCSSTSACRDMDGYEVARRLRAPGRRGFRLIAITGWGSREDRKLSLRSRLRPHLVKPFDLGALDSLLRSFGAALCRGGKRLRRVSSSCHPELGRPQTALSATNLGIPRRRLLGMTPWKGTLTPDPLPSRGEGVFFPLAPAFGGEGQGEGALTRTGLHVETRASRLEFRRQSRFPQPLSSRSRRRRRPRAGAPRAATRSFRRRNGGGRPASRAS